MYGSLLTIEQTQWRSPPQSAPIVHNTQFPERFNWVQV